MVVELLSHVMSGCPNVDRIFCLLFFYVRDHIFTFTYSKNLPIGHNKKTIIVFISVSFKTMANRFAKHFIVTGLNTLLLLSIKIPWLT